MRGRRRSRCRCRSGRRAKNERRGGLKTGRDEKLTGNTWRREERGADKRAPGGGGERWGVGQSEEMGENRSDGQDIDRGRGRGRWEKKDRGGRWDGRRRGEGEKGVMGRRRGDRQ